MILSELQYHALANNTSQIVEHIQNSLPKATPKQAMHVSMLVEDFLNAFLEEDDTVPLFIQIEKHLGEITVKIQHHGNPFNPLEA